MFVVVTLLRLAAAAAAVVFVVVVVVLLLPSPSPSPPPLSSSSTSPPPPPPPPPPLPPPFLLHRPVLIFQPTVNSRSGDNQSKPCQNRISQLGKMRNYYVSVFVSMFVEGFRRWRGYILSIE